MAGASSLYVMLAIAGFFSSIWVAGRASMLLGVSSIVLEIAVGAAFGPFGLSLMPKELTQCSFQRSTDCSSRDALLRIAEKTGDDMACDLQAYIDKHMYAPVDGAWNEGFFGTERSVTIGGHAYTLDGPERRLGGGGGSAGKVDYDDYTQCLEEQCKFEVAMECAETPDIFTVVGHIGVALMIFESGMHFDFEQAKTVGPRACAIAVLGTFLPLLAGTALTVAFGYSLYPEGLSVGVALAPTSVGIALKLLHEARALNMYFGQAVMTAAFVDDVLSLIIFSVLFSLGGTVTFMTFFPLVCGCLFMILAVVAAVKVWPSVIRYVISKFEGTRPGAKVSRQDEALWIMMFAVLVAYAMITHLCGTHLWGCFIAGMSFATQKEAHHVWVRQVKRITVWMIRIFFAATLAWAIPLDQLLSAPALWKGTLMGIGPCILTKVLCAPFMGKPKWVIGWAMVGRAEFAYFIAIMAKSLRMIDDSLFAILIWALLYATVFAPLIFRNVLAKYVTALSVAAPSGTAEEQVSAKDSEMGEQEKHSQAKDESDFAARPRSYSNPGQLEGHLPDLFEEQQLREAKAKERQLAKSAILLQEKDAEIQRLKALLADQRELSAVIEQDVRVQV